METLSDKSRLSMSLAIIVISVAGLAGVTEWPAKMPQTNFLYFMKESPNVSHTAEEVQKMGAVIKRAVFYVHGWNADSLLTSQSLDIKDAILSRNNTDFDAVILVDWVEASTVPFKVALKSMTPQVAQHLKEEIVKNGEMNGMKPENITLACHNLGAHIVALASRALKDEGHGAIGDIVAADPKGNRKGKQSVVLTPEDASHVQCIHTDKMLGAFTKCAPDDIYPEESEVLEKCEKKKWDTKSICLQNAARELLMEQFMGVDLDNNGDPDNNNTSPSSPPPTATIFVLDVSPSMQQYDRIGKMISSTKHLIQGLPVNTTISVIIFGGTAQVSQSPVVLADDVIRNAVISHVPSHNTQIESTSIGSGLKMAYDLINNSFPHPNTSNNNPNYSCNNILLLTDGQENAAPYLHEVSNDLPPCTTINCIAFGGEADLGLEKLALQTNGQMGFVNDGRNNRQQLGQVMRDACFATSQPLMRPIKLPTKEIQLSPNTSDSNNGTAFIVDEGAGGNLQLVINTDLNTTTTDPNLGLSTMPYVVGPGGSNNTYDCLPKMDIQSVVCSVPNATWGTYTLKFPTTPYQPHSNRGGRSRRRRAVEGEHGSAKNKVAYAYGLLTPDPSSGESRHVVLEGMLSTHLYDADSTSPDPVNVAAKLYSGSEVIVRAKVLAIVTSSDGNRTTVELLDNGAGSDEFRDDGVYSRYLTLPLLPESRYQVTIVAYSGDGSAKLRDLDDIDLLDALCQDEEQDWTVAQTFEREVSAGSIRVTRSLPRLGPSTVKDLKLEAIDWEKHEVTLSWTAAGETGDSGRSTMLQVLAATNFSNAKHKRAEDLYIFTSEDIVNGTLKGTEFGLEQRVQLQIPESIWLSSEEGRRLYFRVRHGSNVTNTNTWGQFSNVATPFDPMPLTSEEESSNIPTWVWIVIGVLLLSILLLILAGIFFRCWWRRGHKTFNR